MSTLLTKLEFDVESGSHDAYYSLIPRTRTKVLHKLQSYGLKVVSICLGLLSLFMTIIFISSWATSESNIANDLSNVYNIILSITLFLDAHQMYFFRVNIVYTNKNDLFVFRCFTFLLFAVLGPYYYHVYYIYKTGVIGSLGLMSTIIVLFLYLFVIIFLMYVGFGFRETLRSIEIIRPTYLLSLNQVNVLTRSSFADVGNYKEKSQCPENCNRTSVAEAMKEQYFNIAEYSQFLKYRLIYAMPFFTVSLINLLYESEQDPLSDLTNVYVLIFLAQIPYYLVIYYSSQLSRIVQQFEDEFKHNTNLKASVFGIDIAQTGLISVVFSIASILIRSALLSQQ